MGIRDLGCLYRAAGWGRGGESEKKGNAGPPFRFNAGGEGTRIMVYQGARCEWRVGLALLRWGWALLSSCGAVSNKRIMTILYLARSHGVDTPGSKGFGKRSRIRPILDTFAVMRRHQWGLAVSTCRAGPDSSSPGTRPAVPSPLPFPRPCPSTVQRPMEYVSSSRHVL